ncbi:hypothetical protein DAPPUDRAFT_331699 [Daphnia pulex]|uniref:Choline transporter-like protein n=1 Tax=Daphnia pulex TaxID=6669 RepID=E9HN64_DAPPU|nr:hypothetical protein DAPPUDRAFT_331699 [Daphnia pulex]|eukprot:EFX66829.1 hypothetical protein DAPPUDRAFT_331699 [Daphnia pulex]
MAEGIFMCFTRYEELKKFSGVNKQTLANWPFSTNLATYLDYEENWLMFLLIIGISMVAIVLKLIFWRNYIRGAIFLIDNASQAVGSLTIFPIFPWVFQVLCIRYFGSVTLYASSIVISSFKVVGPESGVTHYLVTFLQFYNVFGLVWVLSFGSVMSEMALADAFASWDWAINTPTEKPLYGLFSALRILYFNIETAALSALFALFSAHLHIFKQSLFLVSGKFLLFGKRQVPIMCAVDGTDFGQSAEKAESLSPRNVA